MELHERKVVVLGAGRSGLAAAELLLHLGARPLVTDLRRAEKLPHLQPLEGVSLELGSHPDSLWDDAAAVVLSPGIPPTAPPVREAERRGLPQIAEIELAAAHAVAPCVAITGSNGKSTVTSMVAAILGAAGLEAPACGNIGRAFSRVVLESLRGERKVDCYVLELSSFQTERIEHLRPRCAAVLNVSEDHLDRHPGLDAYGEAKLRIARNCGADEWLVYGADDVWLRKRLADRPRTVPFTAEPTDASPAARVESGRVLWRDPDGHESEILRPGELNVLGAHNLLNAAAATAVACLFGAAPEAATEALRDFRGLEHRMESCGEIDGVRCINDSKATNVGATLASLGGLENPVWLVLGGRDKDSDFNLLRPLMAGVRRVLLIGEASGRIAASLDGAVAMQRCGDLATAVDAALGEAVRGEVLLLAPACASFDQYDDFEHRGRHFRELVAARAAR